jgi:uncharacterized BrkB/YihY/UPF0761 family membrane protein
MSVITILRVERMVKYMLLGLIVVLATRYIPENKLPTKELLMIGAISTIAFAILDLVSPAVRVQKKVIKQYIDEPEPDVFN